jgi:hypothetical protein
LEDLKQEVVLDISQLILDITGIFDPTPVSDGSNALICLARGNWIGAAISAVGIIHYIGDVTKTAKLPRYLESVRKTVKVAHMDPQWALTLRELFFKLKKTLDDIDGAGVDKFPDSAAKYLKEIREEIDEFLTREKTAPSAKTNPSGSKAHKGGSSSDKGKSVSAEPAHTPTTEQTKWRRIRTGTALPGLQ